jgi:hypothetical protein
MENNMSYAVLISGQENATTTKQVIIATHDKNNYAWARTTNGGRGETNAWFVADYNGLSIYTTTNEIPIVGEVLSTPLTSVDIEAITTGQMPNVLIQKLTKQYRLRHNNISNNKMSDVINDVVSIIETDPTQLVKYRSDGRSDKNATTNGVNKVATTIKTTPITKPVIKITHENLDSNSLSFIPSLSNPEVSGYVERKFANGVSEEQIYDYAIANNYNVLLEGEAGTGKTTSAMVYASKRNLRYYSVNFNAGIESSQLFGKFVPDTNGSLKWQDGGFTECWRNGNAVINLDELSFMPPKQSGMLMPCLDNRRQLILLDHEGEVIPAGENVLIIGSYNQGYRGNNKFNQAFADRFQLKMTFDYDTQIEKKFIPSNTLLELAKQMRADSIAGIYETPISTRLLKNFVEVSRNLGYEFAVDNFLNNFNDEERGSVKLLLDAHRFNLEQELTGKVSE